MTSLSNLSRKVLIAAGFLLAAPIATVPGTDFSFVSQANAQGYQYMSCGELWYARNAIYARQGLLLQDQTCPPDLWSALLRSVGSFDRFATTPRQSHPKLGTAATVAAKRHQGRSNFRG